MRTVELFSGSASFSRVAEYLEHETFTVDCIERYNPDCVCDLTNVIPRKVVIEIDKADVVWMSPPCTTFSMAAGNKHWGKDRRPKTDKK